MAVILGGAEGEIRVVKVTSLSPTSVQVILVGDGVGISTADHSGQGDKVSNYSSLADGPVRDGVCLIETESIVMVWKGATTCRMQVHMA